MSLISGSVVGGERVAGRLRVHYPQTSLRRMRAAVRALGLMLERIVKTQKLAGQVLKRRSGRLSRSINTRFTDTPTSSTATTGTSLSYGRIWEVIGSRAYTILPKDKLALFWKGAAHPVRSVFHPAQATRPFLKPALDEIRPTIRATLTQAMAGLGGA